MTATALDETRLPSLLYSATEEELRQSLRQLLNVHCSWRSVLDRIETSATTDGGLWRRLADDLGVVGLAVPEASGGAGASWLEAALVLEELGRFVAPVPYLGAAVAGAAVLTRLRPAGPVSELAAGESVIVPAVPFGAASFSADPHTSFGDGGVTGRIASVADALTADFVLVPAGSGEVLLVPTSEPSVVITPCTSLDMTRQLADVVLTAAPGWIVGDSAEAAAALRHGYLVTCALLASEQLGVGQWCLDAIVDYLKARRQFGRLIGTYQALKHRCADLWVEIAQARAVARYAAACAARDDADLAVAAHLAQAICSQAAVRAAEECIQLHGGIGFTWEFPAHLYLKRAKSSWLALGSPDVHYNRLADLLDLGRAAGPTAMEDHA